MGPRTLVTGITGFVGGALGARLAGDGESLLALVRASSPTEARSRVERSLARFLGPSAAEASARVELLLGDLASDDTYRTGAWDELTHVVHAAAHTSLLSRREVWRTNVEGTRKLAARVLRAPGLQRFVHVSTAYCCGARPAAIVHEDASPREHHAHVSEYARSKASAELVLAALDWGGRLLVARPSVVVGHRQLGVGPSSTLFWYYRALAALGCAPCRLDDLRDVVSVDYVADALAFLRICERPNFGTYHISAGRVASAPLGEILRALGHAGPCRTLPAHAFAELHGELRALAANEAEANWLTRGLAACAAYGELAVQYFDHTRLIAQGFAPPCSFLEYLPVCVRTSGGASIAQQARGDYA